jgi:hypothetical protein
MPRSATIVEMSCGRALGEGLGNGAPVKCRADQFRRSTVQRIVRTTNSAIDRSKAAFVQVTAWIIGMIVLTIGVGLIHTGHDVGEPFAIGGSLTVFAAMLLFGWLVVRREHTVPAVRAFPSPRNSQFVSASAASSRRHLC